ncbi:MAG: DUF4386 family protein [Chloroflexi bacterium]|nr:DUF4386 family protein [Chloroflexota bacterium]
MGGIAALYQAATYLMGIVFYLFVLDYLSVVEPIQKVKLLVDNQISMYVTHLLMYVVFGIFLVVLALALYERLKTGASAIMRAATALGLIWAGVLIASGMIFNAGIAPLVALYDKDPAQAALVWSGIESVSNGLSSANGEILGGLWTLLVAWAALRAGGLPKFLNYLGVVVGLVGLLSAVPVLNGLKGVFGMSQLVWFVWLGIVMLRQSPSAAVQKTGSSSPC